MTYSVEIWGWEEKENLEKVMLDYTRWLFRLGFAYGYGIGRWLRTKKCFRITGRF